MTEAVRVLEWAGAGSGIASAYAGWLLARMGAQVTRLGSNTDSSTAADASPLELARAALADQKATAELAAFDTLLAGCDILLCDAPKSLEASVGTVDSLRTQARRAWSLALPLSSDSTAPMPNTPVPHSMRRR